MIRNIYSAAAAHSPAHGGYPGTVVEQAPVLCYHPLSCRLCAYKGAACGNHGPDSAGHDRCSGVSR